MEPNQNQAQPMADLRGDNEVSRILNFTEKHVSINLPTLKATARYEMARGGLPANRPIEHWQVIEMVKTLFTELVMDGGAHATNYTIEEHPIFAYEGSAMRLNWPKENDPTKCPTGNYLIGRILTKISFPRLGKSEQESSQTIAIGYHEKGIDIAMGPNVTVCSNMNIFGAKLHSTYGSGKTLWEKIKELLKAWFLEFKLHEEEDLKTIAMLKETVITYDQILKLLGDAYIRARARNNGIANIGDWFTESTVGKLADLIYKKREQIHTAWDLTQAGTELLKPGNNDLATMLRVNNNFNNFVIKSIEG